MIRLFLISFMTLTGLIANSVLAQNREFFYSPNVFTISELDTARLLSDKPLKSPWGAVGRSALMPGWGQIYNEQYLKAGIYFSINGYFAFQIIRNEIRWQKYDSEFYRSRRVEFTWYFALSYLVTMADAYVDAYLYKFDEAMQISQQIDFEEGLWTAQLEFIYSF
jgi:hypothetical protein